MKQAEVTAVIWCKTIRQITMKPTKFDFTNTKSERGQSESTDPCGKPKYKGFLQLNPCQEWR